MSEVKESGVVAKNRVEDGETNEELLRRIMGYRMMVQPPFLVRTLSYVRKLKKMGSYGFDIRWGQRSGTKGTKRMLLRVSVSYCALNNEDWLRFADTENDKRRFFLRIWLAFEDNDRYRTAAGMKEVSILTVNLEDVQHGHIPEGKLVDFTFDIAGVMGMATVVTVPRKVFLKVELLAAPGEDALLWSELCIFDAHRGKCWVPNLAVQLPLRLSRYARRSEAEKIKAEEEKKKNKDKRDKGEEEEPQVGPIRYDQYDLQVDSDDEERNSYPEHPDWNAFSTPPADKSYISLKLCGQPEDLMFNDDGDPYKSSTTAASRIDLVYTSSDHFNWPGIIRHDFRCPFCLRNCLCLRGLWMHLSTDHDKVEFAVRASQNDNSIKYGEIRRLNLVVTFKAGNYNVDPPTSPVGDESSPEKKDSLFDESHLPSGQQREESFVNPNRFGKSYDAIHPTSDTETVQDVNELEDSSALGTGFESGSTDFDEKLVDLQAVQSRCLHCDRLHSSHYQMDKRFCSDFCHIRYEETGKPGRSLAEIAAERYGESGSEAGVERSFIYPTRRRSEEINFDTTLGKRRLFHEVTYAPVLKEHFDECEGDSEEDIDESWRLELLEERIVNLPNASPAEKVLMMMWNKHIHENPLHGDRFVRYQCEMFALENGAEIQRLGLRGVFFEFIKKIIYTHGLTDAEGVASIFECLDGRKKRRSIAASRKPPTTPPLSVNGGSRGGSGFRAAPRGPRTKVSRNGKKRKTVKKGGALGGVSKGTRRTLTRAASP